MARCPKTWPFHTNLVGEEVLLIGLKRSLSGVNKLKPSQGQLASVLLLGAGTSARAGSHCAGCSLGKIWGLRQHAWQIDSGRNWIDITDFEDLGSITPAPIFDGRARDLAEAVLGAYHGPNATEVADSNGGVAEK